MDRSDAVRREAELAKDPRRELRKIELKATGTTGHQDPVEHRPVPGRERLGDRIVDLVATAPSCRADRRCEPGGFDAQSHDPRFDDPGGEPTPAGVDRSDPRAIRRCDQDRHTIRRHDPDREPRDRRDDGIRLGRLAPVGSGSRSLRPDCPGPVDLARKDR